MYGYKFVNQFGELPSQTWISCCVGLDKNQLAHALKKCLDDYPNWPPGAAQFRALAKNKSGDWQHGTAAYREFKPENILTAGTWAERKAHGLKQIEKIRAAL